MTVTVLDRALAAGDAGVVAGERQERPDPEVPEKARRRMFTAQYKLDVVAEYDAAATGEKGAVLRREGLYSSHVIEWRRAGTPVPWRARPGSGAARRLIRGMRRSPGCRKRRPSWSRSWLRPASWWMSRQNCRRSWRRSPRARTPSPGRARDRRGDRPARAEDRHQGGVRGVRRAAGHLVPAAPGQPARPRRAAIPHRDRVQPRALAAAERQAILDMLHSARFADTAPAEAWATLLDEGTYLGSVSTYYRVLREAGESRERRAQATHPAAVKPELATTGPNQFWSWDITKLHGPAKWTYYHLYVILDIFSRYVVGWMVATRESAALAEKLIAATCAKQGITAGS